MTFLATGFQQVDLSEDQGKLVRCLSDIRNHPFFRSVKEESFELLKISPGDIILEIGCGPLDDVHILAGRCNPGGLVIGSDISSSLVTLAKKASSIPNLSYIRMDGQYSAVRDGICDAVREDRVLQHVQDPQQVIEEMYRVLKPGGRCVLFEPDWENFILDGADEEVTRTVLNFWSDQFACGHIGRKLRRMCLHAGFTDVEVHPRTMIMTTLKEAETIFTVTENANRAASAGCVSQEEADAFQAHLITMDQKGLFFGSFTGYLVSGKKQDLDLS
ncbi:class I SAM-dependent methyltransferase [Methanospirillum hungatei]|uniref:class I SAM-dependent methyltransferase n=1 Tax=Methanospirillum hungatei TaxID=2203 RepID=UPI0026EC7864|nr:class I SAM-dependent methyltransferase [Methanospirillum hungatei]MCA1916261.1 class I SAM-dependent methyltransferase [Methanospirillum hungatei]